jgi:hypothetical protein
MESVSQRLLGRAVQRKYGAYGFPFMQKISPGRVSYRLTRCRRPTSWLQDSAQCRTPECPAPSRRRADI